MIDGLVAWPSGVELQVACIDILERIKVYETTGNVNAAHLFTVKVNSNEPSPRYKDAWRAVTQKADNARKKLRSTEGKSSGVRVPRPTASSTGRIPPEI